MRCTKCEYFWKNTSPKWYQKFDYVIGWCKDIDNPSFNQWAIATGGKGITQIGRISTPKWCNRKDYK